MRHPRLTLVALALLCTCGVESAHPLSPANKAELDRALLGTWIGKEDGKGQVLEVQISQKAGGVLRLVVGGPLRDVRHLHPRAGGAEEAVSRPPT